MSLSENNNRPKVKFGCIECCLIAVMIIVTVSLIWCTIEIKRYPYKQSLIHKEYDSIFVDSSKRLFLELKGIKLDLKYFDSSMKDRYDSIISVVDASQKIIVKRQDDLINDLRQETNNNIDKVNLQLTFWIGIIALLGVFIPLILQFKLHHAAKSEIENIQSSIDKKRAELEELQFINQLGTINLNFQLRIIQEKSNRSYIIRDLWKQCVDKFEIVLNNKFNKNACKEYRIQLIVCLIHLSATLSIFTRTPSRKRYRSVDKANDGIREEIKRIADESMSWELLNERMKDLLKLLRSVKFPD